MIPSLHGEEDAAANAPDRPATSHSTAAHPADFHAADREKVACTPAGEEDAAHTSAADDVATPAADVAYCNIAALFADNATATLVAADVAATPAEADPTAASEAPTAVGATTPAEATAHDAFPAAKHRAAFNSVVTDATLEAKTDVHLAADGVGASPPAVGAASKLEALHSIGANKESDFQLGEPLYPQTVQPLAAFNSLVLASKAWRPLEARHSTCNAAPPLVGATTT
ncbi:hypothetical protein GOP47_0017539 [Adiantum capillus-veneris]|uniref:Uncharacterized protein n=1 Tax=Adiantum capillus-veneris TaxID=13818 RepID=A0A9D4UFJ0_ADICA|nr:hypothetical protein GOP47_0017539 [Adiantum capillus-veneris]